MAESPLIWVLADDRAGNRSQALGLAERLGYPFEIKEIRYNDWARLPNLLRGARLGGITPESAQPLRAPWPDMVIAAGRRTAPVARWIKRRHPATRLVQMMWPDAGLTEFDLLILPHHDIKPYVLGSTKKREVLGALHGFTPERLAQAHEEWRERLERYPAPRVGVLVGGSNKHARFSRKDMRQLATRLQELAELTQGSLLITTSRRTGQEGVAALEQALASLGDTRLMLYRWDAPADIPNPYAGILACADALVVTGDSVAMTTEACATGKPVMVYTASEFSPKHARFLDGLAQEGYATIPNRTAPFPDPTGLNAPPPLDPIRDILPSVQALLER